MKIVPNYSLIDFDILVNENGGVMIATDQLPKPPSDKVILHCDSETNTFILERSTDDAYLIQGLESEELINSILKSASVLFIETNGDKVIYEYQAIVAHD